MGGRVPKSVGPEPVDPGPLGAATKGTAEPLAPELLPSVAEPQVRGVRQWMPFPVVEVDEQRLGGGLPDRDDPASSAFAASDS